MKRKCTNMQENPTLKILSPQSWCQLFGRKYTYKKNLRIKATRSSPSWECVPVHAVFSSVFFMSKDPFPIHSRHSANEQFEKVSRLYLLCTIQNLLLNIISGRSMASWYLSLEYQINKINLVKFIFTNSLRNNEVVLSPFYRLEWGQRIKIKSIN